MKWLLEALISHYATFAGRARRKEYWYFVLFYGLVIVALAIVDSITGTLDEEIGLGLLSAIFVLATFIPTIAVGVRRLHDTNRSGWWLLIGVIPLVGSIVLVVFALQDSQPGANRFGPNPKGVIGAGTPMPIIDRER